MSMRQIILVAALIVSVVVPIGLDYSEHFKWMDVSLLVAELAIAFVIYYEIEENRAHQFLAEAHGSAYTARAKIYNAFVDKCVESLTLEERAEAFEKVIYEDAELRGDCDLQLLVFSRSLYMLRWSLFHHNLMVEWFPQVLVRLWLILGRYSAGRQSGRMVGQKAFKEAVLRSLEILLKENHPPIKIYSSKTRKQVEIRIEDMRKMLASLKQSLHSR